MDADKGDAMHASRQQIESVKDWLRAAWVVALVAVVLLWAIGEGRWYDEHMRTVTVATFVTLSLLGVVIGLVFPKRD